MSHSSSPKRFLVTGTAGFIGSSVTDALLAAGNAVVGVDNFDPFYDEAIKRANMRDHLKSPSFSFLHGDICDADGLQKSLRDLSIESSNAGGFDAIIHIAAKAGVRPSIEDPIAYQEVNVRGTQNMLELARRLRVKQFVFASSSSVYGVNPNVPWREEDAVLKPISPYASTKVSGELLGHVYSHLYGIRFVGLRFFTVYGPRQRPDLAINKFARLIRSGRSIPVFGDGSTRRDYTYIDDIVAGVVAATTYSESNYEIFNLGNNQTVSLSELIASLEDVLGRKASIERLSEQPGDVPQTWADVSKAKEYLNYRPSTDLRTGLARFAKWSNNT
ncbi:MAG: epimerase [Verrucomicrobia bacterium]|nr:MAG: epimerase [Verrucomicrobiota bacterium]